MHASQGLLGMMVARCDPLQPPQMLLKLELELEEKRLGWKWVMAMMYNQW